MSGSEPEPEVTYFGNGKVKYRGANLDGQMHGPWEWYRLDGSLMRTGSFDRGRQVGVGGPTTVRQGRQRDRLPLTRADRAPSARLIASGSDRTGPCRPDGWCLGATMALRG